MALAYLLDPCLQFQNRAGVNNVSGWCEVFRMDTDDRAEVYCDFTGTLASAKIVIDNNGRAPMIVEDGIPYRLEVYLPSGELLYTQQPLYPGAGGGGSIANITSSDGSIDVFKTGNEYDLTVAEADPTVWVSSDNPSATEQYLNEDGNFILAEGDSSGTALELVSGTLTVRESGWFHVSVNWSVEKVGSTTNEYREIWLLVNGERVGESLDLTKSRDVVWGAWNGDLKLDAGNTIVFSTDGLESDHKTAARVDKVSVHKIAYLVSGGGHEYTGGTGIIVNNVTDTVSVDLTTVQGKLTAGSNIVIDGDTISATAEPQEQADWDQSDSSEVDYIKNKPDISGMISTALSDYTPTASLASVALSGDYDDLLDKPDLSVYATTSDLTTGLAGKQDTISDLSDIRSGAALGATAVQPAALNDYATTTDLTNGLAGKQDTLTAGSNITISNNVISASAAPQVQADWAETDNTKVDYIKNKPANLVQDANYVHTDNNFTNADATKLSSIATGAEVNVQADWNESDSSSDAYILNKPAIQRPLSAGTGISLANDVVSVKLANSSIVSDTMGLSVAHPVPDPNYAPPGNVLTIRGGSMVWAQQSVTDVEVNGNSVVDSSGLAQITVPSVPDMKELVAGANITITEGTTDVTIAATVPSVPVTDVEVGGSSVVNAQGVAEVPAQVNADWNAVSGAAQILNKPTLASVALSGDYDDLTNKPSIPSALSAGNGIDITSNVVSVDLDGSTLTNGANGLSVTLPVPDTTGASQGDVLSVGSNGIEWATPSSNSDLFYATWGSTTFTEVQNAVNAGKYVVLTRQGYIIPISGIFGTGQFTTAYFQTISNPYNSATRNNLRLITYSLNANNQWNYFLTFVPPDSTASDAGKVLMVNSSGNSEWTTSTVPTIGTITI